MMPASTRAGVVRLNLGDAAQVRTAYAEILAIAKAHLSALPLDGRGGDRAGGNPSTPSPLMGEGRGGGEFVARSLDGQARITGVSVQEMVETVSKLSLASHATRNCARCFCSVAA